MRLFIAGGSGFLGKRVVRCAVAQGHEVTALARSAEAEHTLESLGARVSHGDLSQPGQLRRALTKFGDGIFVNIASMGTGLIGEIVEAVEQSSVRRAVFISTTAVTTEINAPSKRLRLAGEAAVRESILDWTIVRPTMIYGAPDDRNLARLLRLLKRTPVIPLPGGDRLQQPVHVLDLAEAILAIPSCGISIGKTYDVAGPEAITFRRLMMESTSAVESRTMLLRVPLRLALLVASAGRGLDLDLE
jgi:uncharacterized protein YbjT (DUF2867 family)